MSSFAEQERESSINEDSDRSKERLLNEGFGAALNEDYEEAYNILSTEIEGYTDREYRRNDFDNPDCLLNIVAREEEYDKLPQHLSSLVYDDGSLYGDLGELEEKIQDFADKFGD